MLHFKILPGGRSKATNNQHDRSGACERHFKIYIFIRLGMALIYIIINNHNSWSIIRITIVRSKCIALLSITRLEYSGTSINGHLPIVATSFTWSLNTVLIEALQIQNTLKCYSVKGSSSSVLLVLGLYKIH